MCATCEYKDTLEEISDMLDDEDYEFATETLEGIQEWVEEHSHVTPGILKAIRNIKHGGERRSGNRD